MISVNVKVVKPNLKIKTLPKSEWAKIGNDIILGIEDRTRKGLDADGAPFKKYTKEYARKKGQSRVDLSVKGHMLGAIRNKPFSKGVRVQISGGREGLKAWSITNDQKRQFMAVNNKDLKKIYRRIKKWIAKHN